MTGYGEASCVICGRGCDNDMYRRRWWQRWRGPFCDVHRLVYAPGATASTAIEEDR